MSKWSRAWSRAIRVGHAVFYAVMACCFVMAVCVGVAIWMDRDVPQHWGTFTEHATHCDPAYVRHRSCTSTGTWVSDDGRITLREVTLDGRVARHGTVRASYQQGGAMGTSDVVHKPTRTHPELWAPWLGAAVIVVYTEAARRRWRRRADRKTAAPDAVPVG